MLILSERTMHMSAQMLTSLVVDLFTSVVSPFGVTFFSFDDEDDDFDGDDFDDDSDDFSFDDGEDDEDSNSMWFNNEEEWDKY